MGQLDPYVATRRLPVSGSGSDLDLVSSGSGSPDPSKPDLLDAKYDGKNAYLDLLAAWCAKWEAHYGKPYRPTGADKSQLGRLLQGLLPVDLPDLPIAWDNYLNDMSPFFAQQHRHSLVAFCAYNGFNKYRVVAPVLSAREARAVEAGRQFVNGEGTNGRK